MKLKLFEVGPERFPTLDSFRKRSTVSMGGDVGSPQGDETDAVIDAVRKMNRLRASDTSIMGNMSIRDRFEVERIDRLIRAINTDIAAYPRDYGPVPIVRWGGFISEWEVFKTELANNDRVAAALSNRLPALKAGAISWGQQSIDISTRRQERAFGNRDQSLYISAMDSQSHGSSFPWKKAGIVAACSVGAYFLLRRKAQKDQRETEEQG